MPALRVLMGMSLLVLIVAAAANLANYLPREAPSAAANWRSGWQLAHDEAASSGSS